jgi:hypothetical protein
MYFVHVTEENDGGSSVIIGAVRTQREEFMLR